MGVACRRRILQGLAALAAAAMLPVAHSPFAATPHFSHGSSHTLAIDNQGNVFAWGSNSLGQLGQGSQLSYPSPAPISGLPPIQAIAARFQSVFALATDGTVWNWGQNDLGNRTESNPAKPGRVNGLDNVVRIEVGFLDSLAQRANGEMWRITQAGLPVREPLLDGAVSFAVGARDGVAVFADGSVRQQNALDMGQFAPGVVPTYASAPTVVGLPPMAKVYALQSGFYFAGIDRAGNVWIWGCWNNFTCVTNKTGQPHQLTGLPGRAVMLSLTDSTVFALVDSGTVWAAYDAGGPAFGTFGPYADFTGVRAIAQYAGDMSALRNDGLVDATSGNAFGQLGNGTYTAAYNKVTLPGLNQVIAVARGQFFAYALRADGTVFGWGSDYNGGLSGQPRFSQTVPIPVTIPGGTGTPVKVVTSSRTSYVITSTGQVRGWGENFGGQLGLGDSIDRSTPTLLPFIGAADMVGGYQDAYAMRNDGSVWRFDGSVTQVPNMPIAMKRIFGNRQNAAIFAIGADDRLYGFGYDFPLPSSGVFGEIIPPATYREPALVVGAPTLIKEFSTSNKHALAVRTDGSVWAWGENLSGQLGDGTTTSRVTPMQIAGLANVVAVAAGSCHSLALKADGTVWAWGCNGFGELGDGTQISRLVPTQVANLDQIVQIGADWGGSYALRTGGLLFGWGASLADDFRGGTLGDGALVNRTRPVLVLRENGLGSVDAQNWYLDLDKSLPDNRPAFTNRSATSRAFATNDANARTLAALPIPKAADIGSVASTYVLGLVPANFLQLVKAVPAEGSAEHKRYLEAKASGDLVLVNLTASGWQVVSGPLIAFSSGTLNASTGATNILSNVNTTQILGAQFCIGYGTTGENMISAGSVSEVLSVSGATSDGLPCLRSGAYLFGPATSTTATPVSLTATVVGIAPSGAVSLIESGSTLASGSLSASPTQPLASWTFAQGLAAGPHDLRAAYGGDGNNPPSTSAALHHLRQAPTAATLSGPSSAQENEIVSFTVGLDAGPSLNGTVQFRDNGIAVGAPVPISGTSATLVISTLAPGSHSIDAIYAGNDYNAPGTSNAVAFSVGGPQRDTTPAPFAFTTKTNVVPAALVQSDPVTVTGTNFATAVTVSNGQYSIGCDGSFRETAGSIQPGQAVCLRHVAGPPGASTSSTLTVGGVSGSFTTVSAASDSGLAAAPSNLVFGIQQVNTSSAAKVVVLVNTGSASVTVSSVTTSPGFTATHDCSVLASGASCTANVVFVPAVEGAFSGTLTFATSLGSRPAALSGTGLVLRSTLTVSKAGTGSGIVHSSSPSGAILCGSACTANLVTGTTATLVATPAQGVVFSGWSGACTGTGDCQVLMDAARSVTATFSATYVLQVAKAGTGSGTITSTTPAGAINCGSTCSATLTSGTAVTLAASPSAGSTFTSWTGACAGTGSCALTMDAARNLSATFTAASAGLGLNPTSVDFGGQSMATTSPARAVTVSNPGSLPLTVTALELNNAQFAQTNNCTTVAAGGSCAVSVTFTPAASTSASVPVTASLTVRTAEVGNGTVSLFGSGERSLVTHYYGSILGREPDAGGKAFWAAEAARVQALGINVNEAWFAMAQSFYFSAEYMGRNRDNTGFITDLYRTFFNRSPDSGGLAYWVSNLSQGMPREVALAEFMFSTEFRNFTQAIFGNTAARAEVDAVTDFYRGFLARLPDDGGFAFWLGKFREAQCVQPASAASAAIVAQAEAISKAYVESGEYAARARANAQYVGDLYNAFLRRGGDLGGVLFWIDSLTRASPAPLTRDGLRIEFKKSAEFNARVNAIIAQGCSP